MISAQPNSVGLVVIGQNLEWRLSAVLTSCSKWKHRVYVDSGSSDRSVALATGLGWDVIEAPRPYSAAGARNCGAEYLRGKYSHLTHLQMLDGDCRLCANWLDDALAHLAATSDLGGLYGRLKEETPDRNVFHRVTNWEWSQARSHFGGVVLLNMDAVLAVGGYHNMVAGEDIDLCHRLRSAGWRVDRLEVDMAVHDIRMDSPAHWWRRNVRSGIAYAELFRRHRLAARETVSIWLWTILLPGLALVLGGPEWVAALLGTQLLRIYWTQQRLNGLTRTDAAAVALLCLGGKWPMLMGQIRFLCSGGQAAGSNCTPDRAPFSTSTA